MASSAARHLFGGAVVRTRRPRGHWSLGLSSRQGGDTATVGCALLKVSYLRRRILRRWLPGWLPGHPRAAVVEGVDGPARGPDQPRCSARLEGFEPPAFWSVGRGIDIVDRRLESTAHAAEVGRVGWPIDRVWLSNLSIRASWSDLRERREFPRKGVRCAMACRNCQQSTAIPHRTNRGCP